MTRPAPMRATPTQSTPNHYALLGLRDPSSASTKDIKIAYKRALLLHHPDKLSNQHHQQGERISSKDSSSNKLDQKHPTSIDSIKHAYTILSTPTLRAEYDRVLRLQRPIHNPIAPSPGTPDPTPFQTGLETIDLDDMYYDAEKEIWSRPCRCGKRFVVTEGELEEEAEYGVLLAGCGGCSLWLEVMFEMIGEADEEGVEGG
ncbi:MAG: hypothetical protein M4579_005982 [Chaenotheca gracillima]|nr:MAG: hypothetical protein M4579_005982 [Chaenotheca gracillima]